MQARLDNYGTAAPGARKAMYALAHYTKSLWPGTLAAGINQD